MLVFLALWGSGFSTYLVATAQECGGDIRMTNGTVTKNRDTYNMAGGLQICVEEKWATICQGGWENVDARVACRQLGLNYTGTSCRDSCFGNLQIGAAYFSIECEGNENTLQECAKTFARNCNLAVGIHCSLNVPCSTTATVEQVNNSTTSTPPSHGSDSTTENENSISTTVKAKCPPNVCPECRPLKESTATTADLWDRDKTEKSQVLESSCSNNNGIVALSITAALEGLALIGVVISLIITCFKVHKYLSFAPIKNKRSMDNRTYDNMTDFPDTSQSSQLTSADTLPNQMNLRAATLVGGVEGLYDTVASEDSAAEEAVYSVLVDDGGTTGVSSQKDKQNKNAGKIESLAPMSEVHLDFDAVYSILECGDYEM